MVTGFLTSFINYSVCQRLLSLIRT
jgi:hypothetical protein